MTPKEAIETIKVAIAEVEWEYPMDYAVALEMAVELLEKKENGRLVELPVQNGDTVYTNLAVPGWYLRKGNRPYEAKVVFIGINGVDNFMNVEYAGGQMFQFNFSRIGEEVFLTREEAEEALKDGKSD